MRTAITFLVNAEGVAISYSLLHYSHFLRDVKNAGYKPHLTGFRSQAEAEAVANTRLIGTVLEQALPAVKASLKGGTSETDESAS